VKPIRLAVIGAGHLGRIHARIAAALPQFTLAAVVDPVPAAREALAGQHGTQALASYEPLYGQIDAAVVATPTRLHYKIAGDLLAEGIHLLVEKPLTATAADAAGLVAAARERRVVLQVGHVERFSPAWSATLPHVRDPKYITAVRRGGYTFRSTDVGVVLDLMIHDIDLVLSLVQSPVRSVEALGLAVFGPHEDLAQARVTFESGCIADFSAARVSHSMSRTMQLWSQAAFASVDFSTRTSTVIHPSEALLRRELKIETLSTDEKLALKDRLLAEHLPAERIECEPVDAITAELNDFAESIHHGRQPRVSGQAAGEAIAVAEQILDSIARHTWDGNAEGRIGPEAIPGRSVIPSPHWMARPVRPALRRREAS
jgi:predicted dehydrogenase